MASKMSKASNVISSRFAGYFYEGEKEALRVQIKNCFLSNFGPGKDPGQKKIDSKKKIFGAIVPHAGYPYSGACAAHVYKIIAESKVPDVFVLFGVGHGGERGICVCLDDYETPLGIVKIDRSLGEMVLKVRGVEESKEMHAKEHSIEVQLPFLQYIMSIKKAGFKILPVIVGNYNADLIKFFVDIISGQKANVCFIASSDFTHYGFSYGYTPFLSNVKENMYKLDMRAVDVIKKLNPEEFLNFSKNKTICGRLTISTLLGVINTSGADVKASLLKYYTSGDVIGDYSSAVGYGSIIFE